MIGIETFAAAVTAAIGAWWLLFSASAVAIRLGRHPRFLIPPPLR